MNTYYQENKNKILEKQKLYNEKNKDKIKQYQKKYYENKNKNIPKKKRHYKMTAYRDNQDLLPTATKQKNSKGEEVYIIYFD